MGGRAAHVPRSSESGVGMGSCRPGCMQRSTGAGGGGPAARHSPQAAAAVCGGSGVH